MFRNAESIASPGLSGAPIVHVDSGHAAFLQTHAYLDPSPRLGEIIGTPLIRRRTKKRHFDPIVNEIKNELCREHTHVDRLVGATRSQSQLPRKEAALRLAQSWRVAFQKFAHACWNIDPNARSTVIWGLRRPFMAETDRVILLRPLELEGDFRFDQFMLESGELRPFELEPKNPSEDPYTDPLCTRCLSPKSNDPILEELPRRKSDGLRYRWQPEADLGCSHLLGIRYPLPIDKILKEARVGCPLAVTIEFSGAPVDRDLTMHRASELQGHLKQIVDKYKSAYQSIEATEEPRAE